MRLSSTFALALFSVAIEALPVTQTQTNVARAIDPLDVVRGFEPSPGETFTKRQEEQNTETKKDGDTVVEISKTSGTTNDRKGFKWHKAGAAEAILKRQEEQDTETKKDGDTVVEISKTSGTTNDRKGFSWHKAGLLE
ncbi:hypothetical protein WHR41_05854 [Cladosporium halotolerans]|uniref:Uncharacterized protein n=1 Tax=Cladosporium halotolerans TaxID=1052096 RepID=A0AB34KMG0_9PEZI